MTTEREVTLALRGWLQRDAHDDVDSIVDTVLAGLAAYPQRRRGIGFMPWSGGAALGVGVAAAVAVIALGGALVVPSLLMAPGETTSPVPTLASSAPGLPGPTEAPSPSGATPAATREPTTETTAPATLGPTPNGSDRGFIAGVRSPVRIGAKAQVTVSAQIGAACTLAVTYPSGKAAALPGATQVGSASWQWTWTVPEVAGTGLATGTASCTDGAAQRSGRVQFRITDAASGTGWDIRVSLPASRASNDEGTLSAVVTIQGSMPIDPSFVGQHMSCVIDLVHGGASLTWPASDAILSGPYVSFSADFEIGALGPDFAGTTSWTVKCRNVTAGTNFRSDTGTIQIN